MLVPDVSRVRAAFRIGYVRAIRGRKRHRIDCPCLNGRRRCWCDVLLTATDSVAPTKEKKMSESFYMQIEVGQRMSDEVKLIFALEQCMHMFSDLDVNAKARAAEWLRDRYLPVVQA
jgi:hypothetical protein